ncbi:MAG: trypsin-like peptidase domain-containing protein, partial [Phycisphaerales bacterium JB059]
GPAPLLLLALPLALAGCTRVLPVSEDQLTRMRASSACVLPLTSLTGAGTSFFVTEDWGLTAAHVVDDTPPGARIAVTHFETGRAVELALAIPETADWQDRDPKDDWAVIYRPDHASPPPLPCTTPIDTAYRPSAGDELFTVGLLREDFENAPEDRQIRTLRLRVVDPPPDRAPSDELIWMRWPHDFAPKGFSGGPVYRESESGELVAIGLNIQAAQRGFRWWLVAKRLTPEMVEFAQRASR